MPLSNAQQSIADDATRFRLAVCGRRFGKTHVAIRELCKFARHPNRLILYVAPTYRQAKQICWDSLKNKLLSLNWVDKINESELKIELINGSKILLRSSESGDSIRGIGADFVVLDETQDIDSEIFYSVIRPALADRRGHALLLGTPKGKGNWLYDLYNNSKHTPDWSCHVYKTIDGGIVDHDEIISAKQHMDERTFKQEFEASFETYSGVVYYAFGDHNIVHKQINDAVIYVGIDMNIDPMSAVLIEPSKNSLHVFDELCIYGSNTEELAQEISRKYPNSKIIAFPDPAGSARKSSSNTTDHAILANQGFGVKAHRSHPSVKDRNNAVNSLLKPMHGAPKLTVDPKCKTLIEALNKHAYKENTQIPDKSLGFDHITDALGYCVEYVAPVRRDAKLPAQPSHYKIL